jgi:hypothetical protein
MSAEINPVATHHLPIFITPPGQTDVLMVITALFLLAAVVAFGVLFFRLHSLPERMAHRGRKLQFEIVAVMCLIALFTHIHAFWIAALLLALVDIPDVGAWMNRIAGGVERIAGEGPAESPSEARRAESRTGSKTVSDPAGPSGETANQTAKNKELRHA